MRTPFELSFEDSLSRVVWAELPSGDPEVIVIKDSLEESPNQTFAWVSEMQQIHGEEK